MIKVVYICAVILLIMGCGTRKNSGSMLPETENRPGKRVAAIDVEEYSGTGNMYSEAPAVGDDHGFRFIRVVYRDWRNGWMWATDYPTAEDNLHEAIEKTTKIEVTGQYLALTLKDERIFEHPILYLTEPGYWKTDEKEVEVLREYFARGGFVMFDDFHYWQWDNFYNNIKMVFPDKEPVELMPDHPIWSIYYTIDPVEAPSTKRGVGRYEDRYFAMYDDFGRMMCVISYNQDIGDGWEWPNRNLRKASTISFQMAINFIIYSYTH